MWPRPGLLTLGPSTSMMQEEERQRRKLAALAAADLAKSWRGKQTLTNQYWYMKKFVWIWHVHIYTLICVYIFTLICIHICVSTHISFDIHRFRRCTHNDSMHKLHAKCNVSAYCIDETMHNELSTRDISHGCVSQHKKMLGLLVDNQCSASRHLVLCQYAISILLMHNLYYASTQLVLCWQTTSTLLVDSLRIC